MNKKAKKAQQKIAITKGGTQQEKEKTHLELSMIQAETMGIEISIGSEEKG